MGARPADEGKQNRLLISIMSPLLGYMKEEIMEFQYTVTVKYTVSGIVEAKDWEEAEDKVDEMLASGEIDPVCDFDDANIDIDVCEAL